MSLSKKTESELHEDSRLTRLASDLAIPDSINVRLTLVPQRSCKFEEFLLGKIKLMMTMDPRQNGDVLMKKVQDMIPRATKMITNEIASSPDEAGLVIKELTSMSMEAILNRDGYAIHPEDVIHELFKTSLKDPRSSGEIEVKVEVILACIYRSYEATGTLEKNGGGITGTQWVSRNFSFQGDPYKKDQDFEAEGYLKWTSHTGKVKTYAVESVDKDEDDPAVIVVQLDRKQDERAVIRLRGAGLSKWAKQVKDFLAACNFVQEPTLAGKHKNARTVPRTGQSPGAARRPA